METTTKMLNNYRDEEIKDLSLETLSELYRKTHYDCIIAEAFNRLENLVRYNNQKYPVFDPNDYASWALNDITMCLLTYVPGSSNKFSTYFSKVYCNRLRTETKTKNTHKRKIVFVSSSLEGLVESGFDAKCNKQIEDDFIYLPKTLTPQEKLYCKLIVTNYGTTTEIAKKMGVSRMTVNNIKNRLRIKLKDWFTEN